MSMTDEELVARWRADWPAALAHWSKYTRLHDPLLCVSSPDAAREGLQGSFAMIRLADKSVVIDLPQVRRFALEDYGVEVLAHEIGHHVLAPATPTDHLRLIARIRKELPTLEAHAPMVANLFTDLLINDRLQRQEGLRIGDIYRALAAVSGASSSRLWRFYMGIYESLWSLDRGSIGGETEDARLLGDAWLGARIVRVYARDWLVGASRFTALVLPYLVEDQNALGPADALFDTRDAALGGDAVGLSDMEEGEGGPSLHPSQDPRITGQDTEGADTNKPIEPSKGSGAGQRRETWEYGEILRAGGIDLTDEQIAALYYREQAIPHLVPFPTLRQPGATEPQMEGLEPWEFGDSFDEIDWLSTLAQSPHPIPGLTTVRRTYGEVAGEEVRTQPVDLDLYVDSSGSMPDPRRRISFLTLAGAIIALSALRTGAKVQVTLWSGKQQMMSTDGFSNQEDAILAILTGYFGGATAFPIHKLRDTYANRKEDARAVRIVQISDDGISTMFDADERGNSGWDVSAMALKAARGGGMMALNMVRDDLAWMTRAREQGWEIERVLTFEDLLDFARRFAKRHYQQASDRVAA
ncbi:hypothetical protein SH584_04940 [Sphingomonas sp. LY29]|uniref:hypothetical protein n=1 Tax=Sphingomonas sp. LY29 TaxID=3095341 RepID=UPI002D772C09|nr:hypothetical protein [Sphingomonas sp. LY29]WRP26773.1 hypothetical protein SH584_04940 [Sphingomonas sp. LY29]